MISHLLRYVRPVPAGRVSRNDQPPGQAGAQSAAASGRGSGPPAFRPLDLEITTLTTAEELAAVGPEWDSLVQAMPRPSPFLLRGWIVPWSRHYGPGQTPEVHVGRCDGRLVGALPLCVDRRFGVRRLRFLGGPQAVLGDVLLAPGESPAVGRALVEHLRRRGRHDLLDVYGIPGGSVLDQSVDPGELVLIERVEAPVLESRGSWDETYREKTSAKTRNTHRRRRRQLGELGALRTRVLSTPEEIDGALEDIFRLHRLRCMVAPDGLYRASALRWPSQWIDIGATGHVLLAGTIAQPTLDGAFNAAGGTLTFVDHVFKVQEGSVTFDPANAHQQNTGTYHYHANPIALRYLLGDQVVFDSRFKDVEVRFRPPSPTEIFVREAAAGVARLGESVSGLLIVMALALAARNWRD